MEISNEMKDEEREMKEKTMNENTPGKPSHTLGKHLGETMQYLSSVSLPTLCMEREREEEREREREREREKKINGYIK